MSNQKIFITGGASGLGKALALKYANQKWDVCIGDINETRLLETKLEIEECGGNVHAIKCDVTKTADFLNVAKWLQENWNGVDVVVNNAGVAVAGDMIDVPEENWQWILDINLMGVVRGCRSFIPVFAKQGHGQFINIASAAGLFHPPKMSAYNATKAGVVAISETLFFELKSQNINVSVACPSFFRTNLTETLRASDEQTIKVTHRLVNKAHLSADYIAEGIYQGAQAKRFLILPEKEGRLGHIVKRFTPFSFYAKMINKKLNRSFH